MVFVCIQSVEKCTHENASWEDVEALLSVLRSDTCDWNAFTEHVLTTPGLSMHEKIR